MTPPGRGPGSGWPGTGATGGSGAAGPPLRFYSDVLGPAIYREFGGRGVVFFPGPGLHEVSGPQPAFSGVR